MLGRDPITFLLQKTGHFFEYALLALVLYRAVRGTIWMVRGAGSAEAGSARAGSTGAGSADADPELAWGPYLWTLALTVLYAVTDEWHQSFIPHREPAVRDVLIDAAGALAALLFARWAAARRRAWGTTPAAPARTRRLGPQPG